MNFIDSFRRTDYLLSLIRRHATGTPEQLAKLLGVDRRTAQRYIAELKEEGFPVAYCQNRKSYVFTGEVRYEFRVIVDEQQLLSIKGGCSETSKFSKVTNFVIGWDELCNWKR